VKQVVVCVETVLDGDLSIADGYLADVVRGRERKRRPKKEDGD
jgi:hypothetical protein